LLNRKQPDIARRLRRLRDVYGPSQTAFCRRYGFTNSQWSNYEAGSPPSLAAGLQLVKRLDGLTLDWLYLGRTGGLTVEMTDRLAEPPGGDAPSQVGP
jgi:transcriptional regulator with XRE-family HTH domain